MAALRERMPAPSSDALASRLATLCDLGFAPVPPSGAETVARPAGRDGFRVESRRLAMTTLVRLTVIHESVGRAEEAIGRALTEMDRLIAIFDRHDAGSALSLLNSAGHLAGPPPELAAVLSAALAYHRLSHGAFDPTVAPLVDLFRSCGTGLRPREPTPAEIAAARGLVSAAAITVSRRRARLTRSGMALTLDAIAKGFIVDRMAATLERSGIERYLVDAGGDIRAGGGKEGGAPWTVAVRDPETNGCLPDMLHLAGAAVATSGSYERYYDPARRFHHIVDAARGISPRTCTGVTVVAPTALAADALATAALVLGADAGAALVARFPGCACRFAAAPAGIGHSRSAQESPQ